MADHKRVKSGEPPQHQRVKSGEPKKHERVKSGEPPQHQRIKSGEPGKHERVKSGDAPAAKSPAHHERKESAEVVEAKKRLAVKGIRPSEFDERDRQLADPNATILEILRRDAKRADLADKFDPAAPVPGSACSTARLSLFLIDSNATKCGACLCLLSKLRDTAPRYAVVVYDRPTGRLYCADSRDVVLKRGQQPKAQSPNDPLLPSAAESKANEKAERRQLELAKSAVLCDKFMLLFEILCAENAATDGAKVSYEKACFMMEGDYRVNETKWRNSNGSVAAFLS